VPPNFITSRDTRAEPPLAERVVLAAARAPHNDVDAQASGRASGLEEPQQRFRESVRVRDVEDHGKGVYRLAVREDGSVAIPAAPSAVTADRAWTLLDLGVEVVLIR
jgi:hypothetical protein